MYIPAAEIDSVVKRLRRAQGQLGAVLRMIETEQDCRDVVTQLAACSKALDRAGFAMISACLQRIMSDDNPTREEDLASVEKLFLSLS